MSLLTFGSTMIDIITQKSKFKELSDELHAEVIDKMGYLIAVPCESMESQWGKPLARTEKDWYDLTEIRSMNKQKA